MFDDAFKEWLIGALIIISRQLNNVQRKLDALLAADSSVSKEQLEKLAGESEKLNSSTTALAKAIEEQKGK